MQNALSEIEQEAPRANQITAKNAASSIIRAVVDIKYFSSAPSWSPSAPAAKTEVMRCQPVGAFSPVRQLSIRDGVKSCLRPKDAASLGGSAYQWGSAAQSA